MGRKKKTEQHINCLCLYDQTRFVLLGRLPSSGATLNSGVTLNSHILPMETHWIVSITAMSQDVLQNFLLFKVTPYWCGFETTLVVFIWQKHMQNELFVFAFGKKRLYKFRESGNGTKISDKKWCSEQKMIKGYCKKHYNH